MTRLCLSSGRWWRCCWGEGRGDDREEFAGNVAFEAADDLFGGFPFCGTAVGVVAGTGISTQAGEHDGVEGAVGASVAAAVEPVSDGLAGGGFDRADAAQGGERGGAGPPGGGVAGGDQQRRGGGRGRPVGVGE